MAKFCANCGAEVKEGAQVCLACGTLVEGKKAAANPDAKSKLVAGLLGILLGSFGVHNFYLGYTGKAVAQLLITVLTCGFGAMISSIWGLIEGIMILTGKIDTDGHGNPIAE